MRGRKSLEEERAVSSALAGSDEVLQQAVDLERALNAKHTVLVACAGRNERLLSRLRRSWRENASFQN